MVFMDRGRIGIERRPSFARPRSPPLDVNPQISTGGGSVVVLARHPMRSTHTHTHHTTPREIAGNSTQAPVVVGGGVHLADPPAGFSFCFDRWAGWLAAPQVGQDGAKVELQKASITLSDCLACSGCVTSAESVLVEMQNYKELEYS